MFYHCVQIGFAVLVECAVLPTPLLFSAWRKKKGHLHHFSREHSPAFLQKKKSHELLPLPSKARQNRSTIDAENKFLPTLRKRQEEVPTSIYFHFQVAILEIGPLCSRRGSNMKEAQHKNVHHISRCLQL